MPKHDIDYSKILIYKIVSKDISITDCYIGSTTNFTNRKCQHKFSCNNINDKNYGLKIYEYIRRNGGWNNWNMILIEEYNCKSKLEALARERYWLENLKAALNMRNPTVTKEERKEQEKIYNKEYKKKILEKQRENSKNYYEENKEQILEKRKEKVLCECCGIWVCKCSLKKHIETERHKNKVNI
jgi:hypothetical protein